MKFFYSSQTDLLGIRFKPGKQAAIARKHEIMPGVTMGFDGRGNLSQVDIQPVSQHQPQIPQLMHELIQELLRRSSEISQEAMLAIEKTIRLGQEPAATADYKPSLSFDAVANVLLVEFLRPSQGTDILPKKQIMQEIWANFDGQGQLISMELHAAMQHFPDLQRFVEQGQEMLAMQRFFRLPPNP